MDTLASNNQLVLIIRVPLTNFSNNLSLNKLKIFYRLELNKEYSHLTHLKWKQHKINKLKVGLNLLLEME